MTMTKKPTVKVWGYVARMAQHAQHTALHARPRHAGPTKAEKRLAGRVRDFETVTQRNGFHRPGSLQR